MIRRENVARFQPRTLGVRTFQDTVDSNTYRLQFFAAQTDKGPINLVALRIIFRIPAMITFDVSRGLVVNVKPSRGCYVPRVVIGRSYNGVPLFDCDRLTIDADISFLCSIPPGIVLGIPAMITVGVSARFIVDVEPSYAPRRHNSSE